MKNLPLIVLLIAGAWASGTRPALSQEGAEAQEDSGTSGSKQVTYNTPVFRFGLNFGATRQQSAIDSRTGIAGGLTLEWILLGRPRNPMGLSLRARYLGGITRGENLAPSSAIGMNPALNGTMLPVINYADNPGYTYLNNRTRFNEWTLEGIISAHTLRVNTGIVLYGFGGVGFTSFRTYMDLLDDNGNMYNYDLIDPNRPDFALRQHLRSMRNNNFDTRVSGNPKNVFAPSGGIGFGYDFGRVSIVLEHKMTFPQTRNFDGHAWNMQGQATDRFDIYHYTSFNLLFDIGQYARKGRARTRSTSTVQVPRPSIRVHSHELNVSAYPACNAVIKATIKNVRGKGDIVFEHNGRLVPPANYTFNTSTNLFRANVRLSRGVNSFRISARNARYRTEERFRLNCMRTDTDPPPAIDIMEPGSKNITVATCRKTINAIVKHVDAKRDITLRKNGITLASSRYHFDTRTNNLTADLTLEEGLNSIEIHATNQVGTTRERLHITCRPPSLSPPTVTIKRPRHSPYEAVDCRTVIQAEIKNVPSKQNISVRENGRKVAPGRFLFSNGQFEMAVKVSEPTRYTIMASNKVGTDQAVQSIRCADKSLPLVNIINPVQHVLETKDCNLELIAFVDNVRSKKDIEIRKNGTVVNPAEYVYSPIRKQVHMPLYVEGQATYSVKVSNAHGSDEAQRSIICVQEPELPPVVTLVTPGVSPHITENCDKTLLVQVWHVSGKGDIEVRKGNSIVSPANYSYDASTELLSMSVNFEDAVTYTFMASNDYGADQKKLTLKCKLAAIPLPIVNITSPPTSPYDAPDCETQLVAMIMHVDHKSDITITANGSMVPLSEYTFDANANQLTMPVNIEEDVNYIVAATNAAGTADDAIKITCTPEMITICHIPPGNPNNPQTITIPQSALQAHLDHGDMIGSCEHNMPKPVVTVTLPTASPYEAPDCKTTLKAELLHINSKSDIQVTANGQAVPPAAYSYEGTTNQFSMAVDIDEDVSYVIKATNPMGSDDAAVMIQCADDDNQMITICHIPPGNPDNPQTITIPQSALQAHLDHGDKTGSCADNFPEPVVQITHPSTSPFDAGDCATTITANIEHVEDKSGITVKAGPQTVGGGQYSYNAATGQFSMPVHITDPPVTYVIKGSNVMGQDQQSVTINCQPAEDSVVICHLPPGNPENAQTLTIPESALQAHLAHGDKMGTCASNFQEPDIQITRPAASPFEADSCAYIIEATVTNISDKNQLSVTAGNSSVPASNFTFDAQSGKLTLPVGLSESATTYTIEAANPYHSSTASAMLSCKPKSAKITICHIPPGNPDNPQTIDIPQSALQAHLDHGDMIGTCEANIPAPAISMVLPNSNPYHTTSCNTVIRADIEHIGGKGDIEVREDGVVVPASDYTYSTSNNRFEMNVEVEGEMTYTINAANTMGADEVEQTIICEAGTQKVTICHIPPGQPNNPQTIEIPQSALQAHLDHGDFVGGCAENYPYPEITLQYPLTSPYTAGNCEATIEAKITYIQGKQDIEVTHNGSPVAPGKYSYNPNTAIFEMNVSADAQETIVIKATNVEGSDQVTQVIKCAGSMGGSDTEEEESSTGTPRPGPRNREPDKEEMPEGSEEREPRSNGRSIGDILEKVIDRRSEEETGTEREPKSQEPRPERTPDRKNPAPGTPDSSRDRDRDLDREEPAEEQPHRSPERRKPVPDDQTDESEESTPRTPRTAPQQPDEADDDDSKRSIDRNRDGGALGPR